MTTEEKLNETMLEHIAPALGVSAETLSEQAFRHLPDGDLSKCRTGLVDRRRAKGLAFIRALALESQLNSKIESASVARKNWVEATR